ncbi:hypothetical protein ACFVYD_11190 [Streptomyces sp. NPDC058301]|uniref:hypothetical protein n=1 Tax=Streptomyces sp. NPDC058301 TaxID=3346436 RepID=UPI0036EB75DE
MGVAFMKVRGQRAERPYGELGWPTVTGTWPAYTDADYHVTVQDGQQRISVAVGGDRHLDE